MRDPRDKKLAELLVNYSCKIKPGESCLIHATDTPIEFVEELISAVYAAKGYPFVKLETERIDRALRDGGMQANMSTINFEDYYYRVTTGVDYDKMSKAMDKVVEFMSKADKVHITGPGTDLKFSIKGIGAIKCSGEMNIPDGEVYSCPVKDSVDGYITYNAPSSYHGFTFTDVHLEFEKGKIIKAASNDNERITKIFDTDDGSRYVGEFALGCNPEISFPMDNILFDEKIAGSFHFTPGAAYDDADNGNRSAVHWDLVCIQTPEYGGGEIWIDNELIRKDGVFVHPDFRALNLENLTSCSEVI